MKIRVFVMSLAGLMLPFLASCGDDSSSADGGSTSTTSAGAAGSGGSAADISAALAEGFGLTQARADCAAEVLLEKDFSDEVFDAMNEGAEVPVAEQAEVAEAIAEAITNCA